MGWRWNPGTPGVGEGPPGGDTGGDGYAGGTGETGGGPGGNGGGGDGFGSDEFGITTTQPIEQTMEPVDDGTSGGGVEGDF